MSKEQDPVRLEQQLRLANIQKAERLGLSYEDFMAQLSSANRAFDTFVDLGPFYGKDSKGLPPSFRVSAEPVRLPERLRQTLEVLGQDIFSLSLGLQDLPPIYKNLLGENQFYTPPPTWRIDSILTPEDDILVNEIQVDDGADALMIAEQMAYGLCTIDTSTAAFLAKTLTFNQWRRVAWATGSPFDPYVTNFKRMAGFLDQASQGEVQINLLNDTMLNYANWEQFDGLINSSYVDLSKFFENGLKPEQVISAGERQAVTSKGIFALLELPALGEFWVEKLGIDALSRLRERFIKSQFVQNMDQINRARKSNQVVKAFWMSTDVGLLGDGKSVFGPWCEIEDWDRGLRMFSNGARMIVQPFITPKRVSILIGAGSGKNLEFKEGYNRICAKYVVDGDVREPRSRVILTATEATIGDGLKPAGRDCCFTAVQFV